ncbi:MAG: hypothetical protein V4635_09230 [Bacteroidota bacterium]
MSIYSPEENAFSEKVNNIEKFTHKVGKIFEKTINACFEPSD